MQDHHQYLYDDSVVDPRRLSPYQQHSSTADSPLNSVRRAIPSAFSFAGSWRADEATPSFASVRPSSLPRIVTTTPHPPNANIQPPSYPESSQRTIMPSPSQSINLYRGKHGLDATYHYPRRASLAEVPQHHGHLEDVRQPSPPTSPVETCASHSVAMSTTFSANANIRAARDSSSTSPNSRFAHLGDLEKYSIEPTSLPSQFGSYFSSHPYLGATIHPDSISGGSQPFLLFPAVAPVNGQPLNSTFINSSLSPSETLPYTEASLPLSQESSAENHANPVEQYADSPPFDAMRESEQTESGWYIETEVSPQNFTDIESEISTGSQTEHATSEAMFTSPTHSPLFESSSSIISDDPPYPSSQHDWHPSQQDPVPSGSLHLNTVASIEPRPSEGGEAHIGGDGTSGDAERLTQLRLRRPGRQPSATVATVKKGKVHGCPICHKGFPRPSGLQTHMNSHSGARPFKCLFPHCDKSFAVRSNARRHLRTHGVTPPNTRPSVSAPAQYNIGFEPPIVMNVREPDPEPGRGPKKLRWIPSSLLGFGNLQEMQSVGDYERVVHLRKELVGDAQGESSMEGASGESEDELDNGTAGSPRYCELPSVPLPPVRPSKPLTDVDAKFDERNSWAETGTHPYHPSQWRCMPGPALVPLRT